MRFLYFLRFLIYHLQLLAQIKLEANVIMHKHY